LPKVEHEAWAMSPIDRFVLAQLEKEGLTPSPEASRETLVRRVTLDLTGLPPTPEEVDAFLQDGSEEAYDHLVDRLLDSPQYGEHMARYWLDIARYGDTHGLHLDNYREMWPYRDWVIEAFNRGLAYDQFVTEQLAGDLLPDATLDQQIASGFNRCHVSTNEGGAIREEFYVRNVVDRVQTTGTVFLGLTIGCAVCHTHKFDPISQREFYQLFAFFNSMDGSPLDGNRKDPQPVVRVPTSIQAEKIGELAASVERLEGLANEPIPEVDSEQVAWGTRLRSDSKTTIDWTVLDPERFESAGGATLNKLEDASILASGTNPEKETYEVEAGVPTGSVSALRLEGLLHESLPRGSAGRSFRGNVILTELRAEIASGDQPDSWQPVKFRRAWADLEVGDSAKGIASAIDGKTETGWETDGRSRRENRTAIFVVEGPTSAAVGTRIRVWLEHQSGKSQHQFGRFRLSVTTASEIPFDWYDVPESIKKILGKEMSERAVDERAELQRHYRSNVSTNGTVRQRLDELAVARKAYSDVEGSIPTTLVMKELAEPREAFILIRGQYDQRGEKVERKTPAVLPPMAEGLPRDRLGFAKWLLDPGHPLTARVAVNRFWQQCFGQGIVLTAEDFGSQGTPPSHPDLLDWLAVDFIESGWDVRRLMKMIVSSATYRQTSRLSSELLAKDASNRLFGRGARFRLDAEVLGDQALAASGLLVRDFGGPSVKPPQPGGLWFAVGYTSSNTARFTADSGDKAYRRSLYTFWKRTAPPPQMRIFDAPSREECTVRRERTNTPLQALLLMNDPQYVEAARHLAMRTLRDGGEETGERAVWLFRLLTARRPSPNERDVLTSVYEDHLSTYRASAEAANRLITNSSVAASTDGDSKANDHLADRDSASELDAAELAAWTMVANLVLNLDEVMTKE
ncbi:MAG: DUF1549 and DUF1553 domain-containing protein, partial [Planctomycetes bacterium]|nr:DUF1549 and DUF1553 domain-containing protein [Planctomycetota bacterium]